MSGSLIGFSVACTAGSDTGTTSSNPPVRQVVADRFLDNPDRLTFGAEQAIQQPADRGDLVWSGPSLQKAWVRRNQNGWITLASPPLPFETLADIDSIAVRLRTGSTDCRLALHWSHEAELSLRDRLKNKAELTGVTPGPTFAVQGETLSDLDAFESRQHETLPRHLFLRYRAENFCAIESIRVTGMHATITSRNRGMVRKNVRGEIRDTLFFHVPGRFSYRMHSSAAGTLVFGVTSLAKEATVRYWIEIATEGVTQERIFHELVPYREDWVDFRIPVRMLPSGAELEFHAESDVPGDVVFWSHPMLVAPTDQARPNVMLYIVDSLRPEKKGFDNWWTSAAPFLLQLASRGLQAESCYTVAPWTKPSVTSLLTSLYPSVHGVGERSYGDVLPNEVATLQDFMQSHGYVTASFSANPFSTTLSNLDQGFDFAFTPNAFQPQGTESGSKIYSDSLSARILPWVRANRGQAFFALIHSMDPHPPYPRPLNPKASGFSDWDLYRAEVRVNDAQLERLYGSLTELDLQTKTLLVVTSDHGRAFGEHGASGHGTSVHEEEVQVPLILVHETMITPATLDGPASLLDILPSILDHCSIPYEASQFDGLSIFRSTPDQRRDRPLLLTRFLYPDDTEFSHYNQLEFLGWIERDWKLILRVGENAEQQLYDLREDPAERINLLSSRPEHAAVLRRHLTDFLMVLNRRRSALLLDRGENAEMTPQVPDSATLIRLKSLGYLR